ncbi:type VI secretion system baseplate subunit TssF [uncultured Shewanella sp.]|uniref:type VI secretion system baseplate subunit TssF n=1 Tax=uncultured Shewanella sp. TaxID=173975 RepID=UPI00263721C0|nr:type VI secretion system baseplate subunit TssF [uncultured Shewanella sp.]
MINKYYQQQLSYLHELGKEFSLKHPALAPMLAGQYADPDVERLLEGSAFLSGLVQERLDDDFPEVIHGLTQLIFPHYLRPLPSATIMRFNTKRGVTDSVTVKSGTELAAKEVDGVSCLFTTTDEITLHPLHVSSVSKEGNKLSINIEVDDGSLADLNISSLRFHIAGSYNLAVNKFSVINNKVRALALRAGGEKRTLNVKDNLKLFPDFDDSPLLPYPKNSFPAFRSLQEYFLLPQKFLFFDVLGLDWLKRFDGVRGFTIELMLKSDVEDVSFTTNDLLLFCVPAINLFNHDASSILLDHKRLEYKITPSTRGHDGYQVYAVDKVVGFVQGSVKERIYQPFTMFNPQAELVPVYSLRRRKARLHFGSEVFLSVAYPVSEEKINREMLSVKVTCSNASLPEKLQFGDICLPTESSPALVEFTNILTPTAPIESPLGKNTLWRLLSHLYLNQLTLADAENLTALLKLYVFIDTADRAKVLANTKRTESIKEVWIEPVNRLYKGVMIRGSDVKIKLDPDGFPCIGDMYLFGAVLNQIFSAYSSINSFTQVSVENQHNKEQFKWRPQSGLRRII